MSNDAVGRSTVKRLVGYVSTVILLIFMGKPILQAVVEAAGTSFPPHASAGETEETQTSPQDP